ncbi:hypothetical protein [Nocardiopsis sp. L17-MgMaSL7]|uniref:hypothetical protein n=1 Tax=Nocardiopsis sp. L17-MgMaSL7 TaxID=1938893 RepID=UPI0011B748E0|nr:hypothetical protein [Nocardiopsis sp. L17-MgMaSL7]
MFAPSSFSGTGIQAWTTAVDRTGPVPGGFEARISEVRPVPTSLVGRLLFRVSFGLIGGGRDR